MGRQPGFEKSHVVRAARRVFWERGYEEASVPDLESATGLGRSSLYLAFGSKRGLFDAAVTSYLDEVVRPRLAPMQGPRPDAGALATYLTGLRAAVSDAAVAPGGTAPGCLLLNAATAPIAHDDGVRSTVAAYAAELRAAVGAGAAAARPDLPPAESAALAASVTALVISALTLARVDAAAARGCLDAALTACAPPEVRAAP